MEYLEIRGVVTLKESVDEDILSSVLASILVTEFVDSGVVDISFKGQELSIYAEGTVYESESLKALLPVLQDQLTQESNINVINNRWETMVVLNHWQPILAPRLEPIAQLALAQ